MLTENNWQTSLASGFVLQSSGTTGVAKNIFQTPEKLRAANNIALVAQKITAQSRDFCF